MQKQNLREINAWQQICGASQTAGEFNIRTREKEENGKERGRDTNS